MCVFIYVQVLTHTHMCVCEFMYVCVKIRGQLGLHTSTEIAPSGKGLNSL